MATIRQKQHLIRNETPSELKTPILRAPRWGALAIDHLSADAILSLLRDLAHSQITRRLCHPAYSPFVRCEKAATGDHPALRDAPRPARPPSLCLGYAVPRARWAAGCDRVRAASENGDQDARGFTGFNPPRRSRSGNAVRADSDQRLEAGTEAGGAASPNRARRAEPPGVHPRRRRRRSCRALHRCLSNGRAGLVAARCGRGDEPLR